MKAVCVLNGDVAGTVYFDQKVSTLLVALCLVNLLHWIVERVEEKKMFRPSNESTYFC